MIAASQPRSLSRATGIALVVLLHAAILYAIVTGLAFRRVQVSESPIVTNIVTPPPVQHIVPPPPPAFAPPPPTFVPPPEVHIETPPPPPPHSTAITQVTPVRPPAPAPVAAPHVPVSVLPHLDLAASHPPDYPPVSRRLGEEGTVVLSVLVDPSGRAVEAKLVQSSGFARLDQAALDGVKANYRFAPGTIDGKPQAMWYTFKFTWKLE